MPSTPDPSRRDTIIGIVCGIAVLGFIVFAVATMGKTQQKATSNTLTGTIVGRKFTPQKEEQIRVGRGGLQGQQLAGEYVLQVRVKSENRTFDVPVDQNTYEARRDGDSFSFLRPRSEQQK